MTNEKYNEQQGEGRQLMESIENLDIGNIIGTGTFGVVKLATHIITKKHVAMKILIKGKMEELKIPREKVQREIDNLRRCAAHPHLIKLYDVFHEDDENSSSPLSRRDGRQDGADANDPPFPPHQHFSDVILVKEYADGGDLYDYMISKANQRLSPEETRTFFQQLISGVEYLHYKKIAHRDLTLDNILLDHDKQNIKIADFGFSHQFQLLQGQETKMQTPCGSPNYAAPELISGKLYAGTKVDVWSCGVVLYGMNCGSLPFVEPTVPELFKKIKAGKFMVPRHVPRTAQHLLHRMLEVNSEKRITIPEIRVHPVFRKKLPRYLKQSPEEIENERKQHAIDEELVEEVVSLYNSTATTATAIHSRGSSLPQTSQDVQITKDIVEEAATILFAHDQRQDGESSSSQSPEVLRDLSLNYKILAALKEDATHKLTRKKQSSFLGSILGIQSVVALMVLFIVAFQASSGIEKLRNDSVE